MDKKTIDQLEAEQAAAVKNNANALALMGIEVTKKPWWKRMWRSITALLTMWTLMCVAVAETIVVDADGRVITVYPWPSNRIIYIWVPYQLLDPIYVPPSMRPPPTPGPRPTPAPCTPSPYTTSR